MTFKHYMKPDKQEPTNEKHCKVCLKPFKPFKTTEVVCSVKCAIKHGKREVRAQKKQVRDNVIKYSKLMSEAKKAFQAWVRKRDEGKPCISCGKLTAEQWDGSHFFKAEVYRGVVFHENNVNKACSYCNRWLDGNLIRYRENLVCKIGLIEVRELENEADTTRNKKWSRGDLIEIRDRYKKLIKEL
ncbi:MAG: recombination protein NinG [Gammaproteobacteria bacterium]|nr:recombination protein NinG [Gammaproteobacteria bacterium]